MPRDDNSLRQHNRDHLRYATDLMGREWAILAPLIPPAKSGGHPRKTDMREVVNAILSGTSKNVAIWVDPGSIACLVDDREILMGQMGFFDVSKRYAGLDAEADPLVTLNAIVPWADFRRQLEAVWRRPPEARKSKAGRKPWDAVVMFKALVLCEL